MHISELFNTYFPVLVYKCMLIYVFLRHKLTSHNETVRVLIFVFLNLI